MPAHQTDYLIIGAGAVGLAFADTLLDEDSDCSITLVDKHAKPGGHWNDAYPFVALHQPSATYGVNSIEMCPDRRDTVGHNAGMFPLARHAEILAYYERLMTERLLPSGRVRYFPLSEYRAGKGDEHCIHGLFSGDQTRVEVRRKLVDATWFQTSVPATHTPGFTIGEGARLIVPGDLPSLSQKPGDLPQNYAILGAGKTAMDTAVWLLEAGVDPDQITWVRPRDSWMFNRKLLQPAYHELDGLIEFQSSLVEAANASQTGAQMFDLLEERGTMLRIDQSVMPTMFHFALISEGEVAMLRRIKNVLRRGRALGIDEGAIHFADGAHDLGADTLFIDCTASAVPASVAGETRPFFEPGRITLQLIQVPFVPYSAALAAFIEANFESDDEKNALCPPAPLTDNIETYPYAVMANLMSTAILSNNPKVSAFNARSRLHPTGPAIAKLAAEGSPKLARLAKVGKVIKANMPGVIRLGMAAKALHESQSAAPSPDAALQEA